MSLPDLSVFGFKAGERYRDIHFFQRLEAMIKRHGFSSPQFSSVPRELCEKLQKTPGFLTEEEWKSFPYPFGDKKKLALTLLIQGGADHYYDSLKKYEGYLDDMCGDFFELDGTPRKRRNSNQEPKTNFERNSSPFTHGG